MGAMQIQPTFGRLEWNIGCWVPKAHIHVYFTGMIQQSFATGEHEMQLWSESSGFALDKSANHVFWDNSAM